MKRILAQMVFCVGFMLLPAVQAEAKNCCRCWNDSDEQTQCFEGNFNQPVCPSLCTGFDNNAFHTRCRCSADDQCVPAATLIRNYTPPVWQAEPVPWSGDLDRNGIDDAMDGLSAATTVDIVVNYNRCIGIDDIAALKAEAAPGLLQRQSKYLTSVLLTGVPMGLPNGVRAIALLDGVAFIEQQGVYEPTLDVSVPNICVTPGATAGTCTDTAENRGFTGDGINIAIMDTGVDNPSDTATPPTHETFDGVPLFDPPGYDALDRKCEGGALDGQTCSSDQWCEAGIPDSSTCEGTFGDPDDTYGTDGHGTAVASVALGRGSASVSRGVARGAGLIDVKILGGAVLTTDYHVGDAFETIYDQHDQGVWTVHVMNMSFHYIGQDNDGTEYVAQLVNLAESHGIVAVGITGNEGDKGRIPNPAAADRAIAVAASDDEDGDPPNTEDADRVDVLATFSNQGPREGDSDADDMDERKPEVTANGVDITMAAANTTNGTKTTSGTSFAAPHVAGLAALIFEAHPDISPAGVKALIISTSEHMSGTSTDAVGWNQGWGWGLINADLALSAPLPADLTYPNHPPSPVWMSTDISVSPSPEVDQTSTITVQIINNGPEDASDVRVHFGVHDFSASANAFSDIGTRIVDVPNDGSVHAVTMAWTPKSDGHHCLQVELAYGNDTDNGNNKAQRNIRVAEEGGRSGNGIYGPVHFRVQNTYTDGPATIVFASTFEYETVPPWEAVIDPLVVENVTANHCPTDVTVELIAPKGVTPEAHQTLHVAAQIDLGGGEIVDLGGISVVAPSRIPAVTQWGLIVMALLVLAAGTMVLRRRRMVPA